MSSQTYDFDDLQVYDGIEEALQDSDYTFGDLAEDYGTFEAVTLTEQGTIADHGEHELFVRASRIPDADMEAAYFNTGLRDAGRSVARTVASTALPTATGFMAIESGGDPLWVGGTIAASTAVSRNIRNGISGTVAGLARSKHKHDKKRQYRLDKVAEEDYTLDIIGDPEYTQKMMESSEMDDVDVRDQGILMVQSGPLPGEVEEEEYKRFEGEIEELEEEDFGQVLDPEDDDDRFE